MNSKLVQMFVLLSRNLANFKVYFTREVLSLGNFIIRFFLLSYISALLQVLLTYLCYFILY